MGKKSSKVPAPPPVAEPLDIVDKISGFEQVKVVGADGKAKFIRRALPLSPEQEALKRQYEDIVQEQLNIINDLSSPELASQIPEFQPALQAFRQQQELNLEKAIKVRTKSEEEALARRGIENSTSAVEQRLARGRDVQASQQAIDQQNILFGEQLRNQAIGRSQNLLNIASGRQDTGFAQGLQSLGQLQATQQAQLGAQQNYNKMLFKSQMLQAQNNQAGKTATLNALATVAGGAMGGGFGTALANKIFGGGGEKDTASKLSPIKTLIA